MLTNQYSSPTSTSKRKRDVFDFSANIDIARSVENDSHKKPRNINFDSMKSLNLDNPSPFSSPHASPFKPSNFNSPFKPNNFNSPFKPNNSNSSFKNPITSHPLNAPHTSPFKGVSTGFYCMSFSFLIILISH